MYALVYVYNFVGLLVCLFLALKTTPTHYFYVYSRVLVFLKMPLSLPFFWEFLFYSSFALGTYYLLESFKRLGGLSAVVMLLDGGWRKKKRLCYVVTRMLNSCFTLVCWSFVRFYRNERDRYHDQVVRHQERTEYNFLRENCLKIR